MLSSRVHCGLLCLALVACGGGGRGTTVVTTTPGTAPPPTNGGTSLAAVTIRPNTGDPEETPPSSHPPTMIRRALDSYQFDVLKCYTDLLPTAPNAEGTITFEATFRRGGIAGDITLHVGGHESLAGISPCLERVVRTIRIQGFDADDVRIARSYTFENPSISLDLPSPVEVKASPPAPARPARRPRRQRRRRRGAAAEPTTTTTAATTTETPATTTPPPPSSGYLRAPDVSSVVTAHLAELTTCYQTLLTTQSRAAGAGALNVIVAGTGITLESSVEGTVAPLDGLNTCIAAAAKNWSYRASGTRTTVKIPLSFVIGQ